MDSRTPRHRPLLASTAAVGIIGAVLFFVVAATWSFSSPLMSAPDEPAQTVKAVSVAEGNLRGRDTATTPEAPPWVYGIQSEFRIPFGYADIGVLNSCFVLRPQVPAGCAPDPGETGETTTATSYVGTYPPVYYALVGWPARFFDPEPGLWIMRLSSAAVAAALVGLALAGARRTDGGGIVVAGLLIAITPMAVYVASVINPSGMEIAASLAAWTCALAVVRPSGRTTRADIVRLAVALCALVGVRTLSPVLAVGIVACVLLMAARRSDLSRLRRAPGLIPATIVVAVLTVLSVAYLAWSKAPSSAAGGPVDATLTEALRTSLSKLVWRIRQMFGYFGYLEAPPPPALLAVWSVLSGGVLVAGVVAGTWRRRLVLLALVAATALFTVVPEALNYHHVGAVWQGRYSLPVAAGIPILAAWTIGRASWWRPRLVVPITAAVGALWVFGQLIGQAATLRRFVTGTQAGLFDFIGRDGWRPPLSPAVLVVALVVGGTAFAAWAVFVAATAVGDPTDPTDPIEPAEGQAPATSATSASSLAPNASRP